MKPPIDFSLPSALRILLPGFFVATAVFPAIDAILAVFEADGAKVVIDRTLVWSLAIPLVGYVFVIADMHIYMLFEGRRYWPMWLRRRMLAHEEKRLTNLNASINKYVPGTTGNEDTRKYREASVEVRRFKMDEHGEYAAEFPTRLGNLLAAFEEYPKRMYGMDAVFYWPRIWVALDKDLRGEVDGQQAFADSGLYTAAALGICGIACFVYGVIALLRPVWLQSYLQNSGLLMGIAIFSFVGAYGIYRGSLQLQASFGETFKSIFDVFRHLVSVDEISDEVSTIIYGYPKQDLPKREKYRAAWRYLHNYRVKVDAETDPVSPQEAKEITRKRRS